MIHSIELQSLRNAEFLQFQKDVHGIIGRNAPDTLNIQERHNSLLSKLAEIDRLFKKVMASEITAELLAIDERRDNAINGISQLITAYTYHYDDGLRKAAAQLDINLKLYGTGIARMNYQAETTTITALLNDWNTKPELSNATAELGLAHWIQELSIANSLFNTRYLDRTQEMSDANPDSLRSKRGEMNEVFYGLRDRINALHTITESDPSPYSKVISELNTLIDQYNQLISQRGRNTAIPEAVPETPGQEQQ